MFNRSLQLNSYIRISMSQCLNNFIEPFEYQKESFKSDLSKETN